VPLATRPAAYTDDAWAAAAWESATWTTLDTWFAWDVAPAYYVYGDNVTYANDYVYYGSQPVATQQQYYQGAVTLADSGSADDASQDSKWLPLGVFGLMTSGQKTPEMIFQLAIDKNGIIRGNYYDQTSDAALPVHGAVDKKNQRVAWRVGNNKNLVVETGLSNLTEDESTALVHFGADKAEQCVLVRVKASDQPK
jgi:hypothetical protein